MTERRLRSAFAAITTVAIGLGLDAGPGAADDTRSALANAKSWYYRLAKVDPLEIAGKPHDVVVVDHAVNGRTALTPAQVAVMRTRSDGRTRPVIAYISIGEAEEYRYYWDPAWTKETDPAKMPAWYHKRNCAWPDNHAVKFWHREWKDLIYGSGADSFIGRIAAAGFDGLYLDRVDIWELFRNDHPSAKSEMITFVTELAAAGRALKPGFIVIAQNADELLRYPEYRQAIDGLGKEDLLHGMRGTGVRNPETSIRWSLDRINLLLTEGKPVFAVEYLASPAQIAETKLELSSLGLVPTAAHRSLDGTDPTAPRVEPRPQTGTPEFRAANCDASNSW